MKTWQLGVLIGVGLTMMLSGVQAERRALATPPPAAPAPAAATAGPSVIAFTGARVFDGERVLAGATVVVRDGRIEAVGAGVKPPEGATIVDGTGKTLLPGLIDAHTHAWGDALDRALQFGVTTELDMFTDFHFAQAMRDEQKAGNVAGRADLLSAGTLVTAPGGHGTEYGTPIPTISGPAEAQAFVDARIAEGSDYIKIVVDDGSAYGLTMPTIDRATLEAVVKAARAGHRMSVVHIGTFDTAVEAIDAGASGLVHIFADRAPAPDFGRSVKAHGAFVVPTLTVTQSLTGTAGGGGIERDPRIAPYLLAAERANLAAAFRGRPGTTLKLDHAFDAVRQLRAADVPILAGTDAPNPGTAHGVSLHRELELLVQAGLTPAEALAAATSLPAAAFGLADRGRLAPGLRADLVLVEGDPTADILATRAIAGIWKGGAPVTRREAASEPEPAAPAAAAQAGGKVSDFESGKPDAAFGAGWMVSTDQMMGGQSKAEMRVVSGGANGTAHALEITGGIAAGSPFPWAGAMFSPASPPMTPANLSAYQAIAFWARGDGGTYRLMAFATSLGQIPAEVTFVAGPRWEEHVIPFASFQGVDAKGLRAILFSAGPGQAAFRLQIDEVRFKM